MVWELLAGLGIPVAGILAVYHWIRWVASPYVFTSINEVPAHSTLLLLGTAKYTGNGAVNSYFRNRILAVTELFKRGKVGRVVLSGGSRSFKDDHEVEHMKDSLLQQGLPDDIMIMDRYGMRTWDSIQRCKLDYGIQQVIIVSQPFHTARAVFIARQLGMQASAFNADKVQGRLAARMFVRECLARVKCLMDLYVLHPVPAYKRPSVD